METSEAPKKRRIVPPLYFFAALALMVALDRFLPLEVLVVPPYTYLGWLLFALGLALALTGKRQFERVGTPVRPFEPMTALVTDGVFAFSRNPMYLGLMLGLLGIWLALGSLSPLAVVPVFFVIIRTRFVAAEEQMLESRFGEAYLDYKRRVRRWL